MTNKSKLLFRISLGLNLVLIGFVVWGLIKMNFVKEQVLLTEVQQNLVELEGLIKHQMDNNWSEPNLVTTELGDVLNGIWLGMTTGNQLGTLSKKDEEILSRLHALLYSYPHDQQYRFSEVTKEDQKHFGELREDLREVGFGMNLQINNDMNNFIEKADTLAEKLRNRTY